MSAVAVWKLRPWVIWSGGFVWTGLAVGAVVGVAVTTVPEVDGGDGARLALVAQPAESMRTVAQATTSRLGSARIGFIAAIGQFPNQ